MNRVALGLCYDGHDFEGWQTQPHGRTVQDHLTKSIEAIAHEPLVLVCAGRTDTGVHARQQVVHFDTSANRPVSAWVKGVNNTLPASVSVLGAKVLDDEFHARFSAISRTYRYYFYSASVRDPFKRFMTWVHYPLDLDAMRRASACLIGTHDFSAFRASQCQAASPVRTLHAMNLLEQDDHAFFEIHGNAFLHHMVRNLMGSLMEVGLHRQPEDWLREVLESKNRSLAAKTYPAQGLSLWNIEYPPQYGIQELFA
ncbi:MAG: tRNA pseudouridine(38-40) synthase TruA [Gammaproteobacteria bacterium]|uniref:tRNA pseudouridine(38-40) synthase TruA n=1 Tax=Limnobacter sp. TaxID=2003368 RepID=UPI001DFAB211|nr:tRNA pseudouridine(38-40) synthase TruA [Limnobacter sp.]MBU0783089.1 tRNA pseudouridine(38-40) synthase TruA [Gammaproteobacteria bacterium]MBU0849676.1 tRNA pseudouridine(38-40) synthase TruA [Gammaproteobacteria bacterium]MBU1266127.1 tRNA pseudouridine(38-40) synthase TruA [Gammaproteobacteria bacterium]MBU1779303.1 tRNA pseudouridine(38-40) synthase TruA [Gammaproteobacteria bacterium]MBU2088203.1 tRNA pseudouridine(38-40) synthase TruA [Gammaproteobacteria bacterium]